MSVLILMKITVVTVKIMSKRQRKRRTVETEEEALDVIATLKQRGKRICGNDVCSILCLQRFWILLAEHVTFQDEMERKWPGMVIFSKELGHRANPPTKNQTRLTNEAGATVWFKFLHQALLMFI
ncbi:hypothetical protein Pint_21630 [Pistacia integerrima]|uniref:Uncharacterized protein n=1 Tax=Pistacia integerrima TaxID=434235 RepID=A0ACC0XD90_9ROSI|nr:hypothetical protein Pint_21630 [Pistacia integerrima]